MTGFRHARAFATAALVMLAAASAQSPGESRVELVLAYPNLTMDDNASAAAVVPDGSQRVALGLQRGQILLLPGDRDAGSAPLLLDLREKLRDETEFEEGLHGVAFHPDFKSNGRFYVCYTQRGPRRTVLSEFVVSNPAAPQVDPRSERVLLEYPHPLGNHWGGGITFGPDGYLYLGIGDGGLRDDPYGLGQNLWSLHGKILRLDVNTRSGTLAYGIPADNPYAEPQEIRSEIWATGFRNPWGMAFDKATGTLWCGDVGQDRWEEVNIIERGANYGWSEHEGPERLAARNGYPERPGPFVAPIHAYPHSDGISITGGFVYRGKRLPALSGHYLFGDWGVGKLWALGWNPKDHSAQGLRLLHDRVGDAPAINPTVIIADAKGEPLIFSHHPSQAYTLKEPQTLASSTEEDEVEDSPGEPEDPVLPPDDAPADPDASSSQNAFIERALA